MEMLNGILFNRGDLVILNKNAKNKTKEFARICVDEFLTHKKKEINKIMVQEFIYQFCGSNYTQIAVNHNNKTFTVYDELTDSQKDNFDYLQDYFSKPIMRCQLHQSEADKAVETLTANGYKQVDTIDSFMEV